MAGEREEGGERREELSARLFYDSNPVTRE
jgi:hypothetical protein